MVDDVDWSLYAHFNMAINNVISGFDRKINKGSKASVTESLF